MGSEDNGTIDFDNKKDFMIDYYGNEKSFFIG